MSLGPEPVDASHWREGDAGWPHEWADEPYLDDDWDDPTPHHWAGADTHRERNE